MKCRFDVGHVHHIGKNKCLLLPVCLVQVVHTQCCHRWMEAKRIPREMACPYKCHLSATLRAPEAVLLGRTSSSQTQPRVEVLRVGEEDQDTQVGWMAADAN